MTIGTLNAITGLGFFNATSITTSGFDAPAGSTIIIFVLGGALNIRFNAITCTDNATGGSNSYVNIVNSPAAANANNVPSCIIAAVNTARDLPIGSTITLAGTNSNQAYPGAWAASGIGASDVSNLFSSSPQITSLSLATGTLGSAYEIVFGSVNAPGATANMASNFTSLVTTQTSLFGYEIVSSTGSVTFSPSWTTATSCTALVAAFAGSQSAGGKGGLLLFGVGSVGWTPLLRPLPLLGATALLKAGKAIRRNATLSRRSFLIGHNGGPPLDD